MLGLLKNVTCGLGDLWIAHSNRGNHHQYFAYAIMD